MKNEAKYRLQRKPCRTKPRRRRMLDGNVPLNFMPDRKKRNLIKDYLKAIDWVEKVTFKVEMGEPVLEVEHTWDPQEAHMEVMRSVKEKLVGLTVN